MRKAARAFGRGFINVPLSTPTWERAGAALACYCLVRGLGAVVWLALFLAASLVAGE